MQSESQESIQTESKPKTSVLKAVSRMFDPELMGFGQTFHISDIQEEITEFLGSGLDHEVIIVVEYLVKIGWIHESSPKNFVRVTERMIEKENK